MIVNYGLDKVHHPWVEAILNYGAWLFILYLAAYLWLSMKRFYQDRYLILMFLLIGTMLLLFILLFMVTVVM